MSHGTITRIFSAHAEVAIDGQGGAGPRIVTASLSGRLNLAADDREKSALAAGDRVLVEESGGEPVVVERFERSSQLSRRHPRLVHREQVIAANVDRVLVVAATVLPPLRAGLVDRYLVAASAQGIPAAVCLTKCDLVGDELARLLASPWEAVGIRVFPVALVEGSTSGVEELRGEWLAGHATVLVGQSAVGKSTLRNAVLADSPRIADTGAVSAKTGRGRHVTTAATFEPLPPSGFLVDTPGSRQFEPWNVRAGEVQSHFPEFADLECRYSNCTHAENAGGCALVAAVEADQASEERLDSLRAIAASLPG